MNQWRSTPSRFKKKTLGRPVLPRATNMPPWEHVKTHKHTWGQLAYTSNGVLTLFTPEGKFIIPPQQALWLPPGLEHESFCRYGGKFRSVYIDEKFTERLGTSAKSIEVDSVLRALILEICTWQDDYQLDDKTQRFIDVFIDRIELAKETNFVMPLSEDVRLMPIISELLANPGNKLTIEQWGEKVGASSRTLSRLFNKQMNMGFSQWKQKLKSFKAVELLEAGYRQQDIAHQLGFESVSAFNTAFKHYFGVAPNAYVKSHHVNKS